jgi:hypothetical protein
MRMRVKAILPVLLLSLVAASLAVTSVGRVRADDPAPQPPTVLIIMARGVAVDVNASRMLPAGQIIVSVVLNPVHKNLTFIPLVVVGGVIKIGPTAFNITAGRGVIIVQRRALQLFCNGTTPNGDAFTYRLFGRFIWTQQSFTLIRFVGMLHVNDNLRYIVFLLGTPKLRPLER